jgi:hypothetical protein
LGRGAGRALVGQGARGARLTSPGHGLAPEDILKPAFMRFKAKKIR